tara:strand:+ start:1280 stop:1738 length:459 start_codon:yes stop_codon:yes gene_type:complete
VLQYYRIYDEGELTLAHELNTSTDHGTDPEDIVRVASNYGIDAVIKRLTLEKISEYILQDIPVIVTYQAWSIDENDWADVWEDGHYSIIIGIDDYNVYLEDPSLSQEIGYIPREEFLERWHDVDRHGNKLLNTGIICHHPVAQQALYFRKVD